MPGAGAKGQLVQSGINNLADKPTSVTNIKERQLGGHNMVDEQTALSARPAGWQGVVHALRGGHDFRSRVANLGFTAGVPISVVQNFGRGPMLVSLRGTLVALGRAEAAKVLVGEDQ